MLYGKLYIKLKLPFLKFAPGGMSPRRGTSNIERSFGFKIYHNPKTYNIREKPGFSAKAGLYQKV
jgi:hypothetical protein